MSTGLTTGTPPGGIGAFIMRYLRYFIMGLILLLVIGYFTVYKKYIRDDSTPDKQETVVSPKEKSKDKTADVVEDNDDDDAPKKKHHKKFTDDSDGTMHSGGIHVSQTVDIDGDHYSTSIPDENESEDEDDE